MTEDEAKTKWCPQSGEPAGHPNGRCVTTACMWWVAVPERRDSVHRSALSHWRDFRVEDTDPNSATVCVVTGGGGYCGALGRSQ